MKLILVILFLSFTHVTVSAQQVQELIQRAQDWKNAYNSNDTAKLASFYTEDAFYVSPHVPNLVIQGLANIRGNFRRGVAMGGHVDTVEVLASGSSCDLAYLVCRYEATNSEVKASGRNVLVMKKINGKWLITAHASVVRDSRMNENQ